jgi:ABC-type transporter Mla MlaB component
MLRISVIESAHDSATLRLEGHLAGAWIVELRETCERILASGRNVTLDLGDVSLIERPGFDLLTSLSHRAVSLVRCSPFQEEQLRQAAAITQDSTTPS